MSKAGFKRVNQRTSGIKRSIRVIGIAGLLAALIVFGRTAAIHDDNLFELGPIQGADILGDGVSANGPDWADIFDASGNVVFLNGGIAAAFLLDNLSQSGAVDPTTFAGGGGSNKNDHLISTWHWDSGTVPAKDDLANTYAYAKVNSANNHLILYAGFERLSPDGDSHVDIEFNQALIGLDEEPPCDDPGADPTPCTFTGEKMIGDIVVSMDFTVGGSLGSVEIREWKDTNNDGVGDSYVLIGKLLGEGCNQADTICGFNNGGNIDGGPWLNFDRHGSIITMLPRNAFTEFGVDVTALAGETPCIASAMGKTRSSQSFTAELKDFSRPVRFPVCSASITIEPDDVNEVRQPHTFVVTVNKIAPGATTPAPDGTIVTVTLTDANGTVSSISSNTCSSGTVGGKCNVTFTSNTAGTVTGHASADVAIDGLTLHVETDGTGSNGRDAVKRFVDALITIGPPIDTNGIQETHTFTVTVKKNVGDGQGFVIATSGDVNFTLTNADGAISLLNATASTCDDPGSDNLDDFGQCTIIFTSNTPGRVIGHASVTILVDGVTVVRQTDGVTPNSGEVVKIFVAGSLRWLKHDNAGSLLGGATFQVCRTHNFDTATQTFVDAVDVCITVVDDTDGAVGPGDDQDADAGEFQLITLVLGRYTVKETVAPPGFAASPDTKTAELTMQNRDAVISIAFVNERPIVKLTQFGYVNTPRGTPTRGITSGVTTYTIKLKNFGGAQASLNGSLTASISGAGNGTFSCISGCTGGSTLTWSNITLAPGAEHAFNITVEYSNVADGAVIDANLTSTYTLNGLTRVTSGSPALIRFTLQSD